LDVKDGGTTFAAIQYGNLAVIAPWLDLSQQLVVEGCFHLIQAKGRVGVTTYDNQKREQFRTVEDDYAVIQTEKTEDTRSLLTKYPRGLLAPGTEITLDDDGTTPEVDFILVPVGDSVYRLLMRVQTQSYSRIVDPSDTLKRVTRTLPLQPTCRHPKGCKLPGLSLPASIYSFDDIVGKWNDERLLEVSDDNEEKQAQYHVSERLTSHLQHNIAMALSIGTIAAIDNGKCFDCMLKIVEKLANPPDRADHLFDRFLIVTGSDKSVVIRGRV
jgi:hypothetical protein